MEDKPKTAEGPEGREPERRAGRERRPPGFMFPLLLIGLGVILLLNSLGVLEAPALPLLARLWPVLLILIGLDILIGRRSALGNLVLGIVLIAVLAGAAAFTSLVGFGNDGTPTTEQIGLPIHTEAEEVEASIEFGAGQLSVEALPGPADFAAEVDFHLVVGRGLDYSYEVQDGHGELFISDGDGDSSFGWWNSRSAQMSVALEPSVPIDLDAETGVGEMTLDLSGLEIEALTAELGVGDFTVRLPEEGEFEADISVGVGELTVIVPDGLEARIESDMGIGETDISPSRFVRDGDDYVTRGSEAANSRVVLRLDVGIGAINVR